MNPSKKLAGLSNHPIFLILRVLLAGIMLYAAVPKFFDWEAAPRVLSFEPFSHSVHNYRLLPLEMVNLVAMTIPPVELLGALTLLTGLWLRAGSLMLALLQGVFLFGVAQAFYRGLDISCGCFVGVDSKVGWIPLIRDSIFFAGFVLIFLTTFKVDRVQDSQSESPPQETNDQPSPAE
ncbi:MAG: DoxX family membrane protein [Candidatus Omnitrophica bacterium]|nr:DoxX family membrane protein [Candidatus Omnitrophota bacterium]